MRLLLPEEQKIVKGKLATYLGNNLNAFLENRLVLHRCRVFIVPDSVWKAASSIPRKHVVSIGTCLGKFTKTRKFHLQITGLDYLSYYVEHKVWVKPQAEMQFLYGNHVLKRHITRMTENAPAKAGVVIMNANIPLGFGILNKSSNETRLHKDSEFIAVFNQGDTGLYVRQERELFGLSNTLELREMQAQPDDAE